MVLALHVLCLSSVCGKTFAKEQNLIREVRTYRNKGEQIITMSLSTVRDFLFLLKGYR